MVCWNVHFIIHHRPILNHTFNLEAKMYQACLSANVLNIVNKMMRLKANILQHFEVFKRVTFSHTMLEHKLYL